jgi:hypothetical protein
VPRTVGDLSRRWHNQLKPGIDNDRDWSAEEEQVLFRVQEELGNKWAHIAKELPGRTDNNIKNYFYSTLRKALRKVNTYVQMHKRENHYRNIKEFKQQTLSKILSVAEKKYENKINLRNEGVEYDAQRNPPTMQRSSAAWSNSRGTTPSSPPPHATNNWKRRSN